MSIPASPSNRISQRIAGHFGAVVDPVLASWWDDGIWETGGGNEFRWPVSPESWLDSTLDCLWPGLMPCHLIPLIGNDVGDYLCVRVSDDGRMGEIVHWYHGGGDWIPWGKNLAQAIAIDAWSVNLPGICYRNAESAGSNLPKDPANNGWLDWASRHVNLGGITTENVAAEFSRRDIGLAALLAGELVQNRLVIDPPLVKNGSQATDIDSRFAMDEPICERAIEVGPGLSWTWDTAGRAAEAAGDVALATARYIRGARCSIFSSQSVRVGTHRYETTVPKFSIARLQTIAPEVVRGEDYFRRLTFHDREDRQRSIHSYWLDVAAANADGSPAQVFALHMSAWDIGLSSMPAYEKAIECLIESADIGGMRARASVAKLHLRTLQNKLA